MTSRNAPSRPPVLSRPLVRTGLATLLLAAAPVSAQEARADQVEVLHAWSRAVPPGARVAGGYLTIVNAGAEADRLVGVASDIAGRTEIHEMAISADGMMTMRPLREGLEVPAGGEVALAPGGYHIMFMDLKTTPTVGRPFRGTLTFEQSGAVEVEFQVEPIGAMSSGHGG